jgi:hypothetical protein
MAVVVSPSWCRNTTASASCSMDPEPLRSFSIGFDAVSRPRLNCDSNRIGTRARTAVRFKVFVA